MSLTEAYDQGFETPQGPPQLEAESLTGIRALMAETPVFDESLAVEFLHMMKSSVAVRAAFQFVLVKGREKEVGLRDADTMDDVRRAQGAIKFSIEYYEAILGQIEAVEQMPRSEEDELEE